MNLISGFGRRRLAAIVLGALIVPIAAQQTALDKPFLDANDFYLRSAGFKIKFATDAADKQVMDKLPTHRFVAHKSGGGVHYLLADPKICVCIFVGTKDNLESYRSIVANPVPGVDNVPANYKTQASALLSDMSDIENDSLADYFRDYY
jgi:hypothetical protein